MAATTTKIDRIEQVLGDVLDPCSAMTHRPTDIVEFGLVENIEVEGSMAHIEITTTPMCMYVPYIRREICEKVSERVSGIEEVDVTKIGDLSWTNDRMSDEELAAREQWKQEQIDKHDLEPYTFDDQYATDASEATQ